MSIWPLPIIIVASLPWGTSAPIEYDFSDRPEVVEVLLQTWVPEKKQWGTISVSLERSGEFDGQTHPPGGLYRVVGCEEVLRNCIQFSKPVYVPYEADHLFLFKEKEYFGFPDFAVARKDKAGRKKTNDVLLEELNILVRGFMLESVRIKSIESAPNKALQQTGER